MTYARQKDPRQIATQLNISMPWQDREDYAEIAADRKMSMAELVRSALAEYCKSEMAAIGRSRTTESGATS
jgi:hypothetical protein